MRIKRFTESDQVDISPERVNEIIEELKDVSSIMDDKFVYTDELLNELNNYKNQSKRGNDQIDDSISALQMVKKDIEDCRDKLDTIINNLLDYNESGRKMMYSENK